MAFHSVIFKRTRYPLKVYDHFLLSLPAYIQSLRESLFSRPNRFTELESHGHGFTSRWSLCL